MVIPLGTVSIDYACIYRGKHCPAGDSVIDLVGPGAVHMGKGNGVIVEDFIAIASVDEDIEVEVLVGKGIAPAEGELRKRIADIGTVLFIDHSVLADIFVLDITYPHGISTGILSIRRIFLRFRRILDILERSIYASDLVTIEVIERLADFRHTHNVRPLSVTYESGISRSVKADKLVSVEGNLEVAVPGEILDLDRMGIESNFKTLVLDRTEVTFRSCKSRRTVTLGSHIGSKLH